MPSSPVCLDASFIVHLLLSEETAVRADSLWEQWHRAGQALVAPTLLYYEVSNVLHRYVTGGILSQTEAMTLLDTALSLDIKLYGDAGLHRRAVQLAESFSLPAACDAHYLALAERLGAEFWTADRRLVKAVRDNLPWVNLLTAEPEMEDT